MFRRRTEAPSESAAQETANSVKTKRETEAKGRPTPKRRDAQQRTRQPITAPKNRKDAYKRARERQADGRSKARAGIAKGDDRYLPARDKGPVRRLARDYVDSRRTLSSNFMIVLVLIMVLSFTGSFWGQVFAFFAMPIMILILVGEGLLLSRAVKKVARERYPNESVQGIAWYTSMRNTQMRFLRMPKPALKPGDQSKV